MDAIEAERCTSIYGTPTMFVDILAAARQKKPDVSHVETGIMAGRGQGQGRNRQWLWLHHATPRCPVSAGAV